MTTAGGDRRWLAAVACLALVAGLMAGAPASASRRPDAGPYVPGRVLVGFEPGHRSGVIADLRTAGAHPRLRAGAKGFLVVDVPGDPPAWAAVLSRGPWVRYAEPDYLYELAETVPDDPSFGSLWGMQEIGMPSAWDVTTGSSAVTVAVIDTGLDMTHPDLADRLWSNPGEVPGNRIDDDGNGWVDDVHGADCMNGDGDPTDDDGHGTHVAGTIGAAGNDGVGVVGVNWNVRLMPVKIFSPNGSAPVSVIARCLDYTVAMGARISNNSYGGSSWSQALYDAFARARDAGMLMAVAAGNSGQDADLVPMYPAAFDLDHIISVAASTQTDTLAAFSNYGATSVDIAAPGVEVYSTLPGGYGVFSGTSMATPHVAGAAALLASLHPAATATWLREAILSTAAPAPGFAGTTATGGSLDVAAAVRSAAAGEPPVATAPSPSVVVNRVAGTGGTSIRLRWSAPTSDGPISFSLQRSGDGLSFSSVSLTPPTALAKTLWAGATAAPVTFRVRASTAAQGIGPWATAPAFALRYVQESSPWVIRTGAWSTGSSGGALGGQTTFASSPDAGLTISIPAGNQAYALVLPRGPGKGKATVWVDGSRRALVDLYRSSAQDRWLAFGGVLDPSTAHVVEVRVTGTKRPASSGTRVDVDAVAVLGP